MRNQSASSSPAADGSWSFFDVFAVAHALREELSTLAVTSDLRSDYQQAREKLRQSGLLALRLPRAAGGYGGSQTEAIAVSRILAQADAGIAQLLQPHYGFTDTLSLLPSDEAQRVLFQDVLNGERIANAASERGGKHSADFSTTLIREGDRYRINGRKYYATGSIGARWITVIGKNEQGGQALAYIRTDAPGVTLIDDWNGLGQRGSSSGSLILENVEVSADYVIPVWDAQHRGAAWHESGRLIHAAIDLGIAEGVIQWGLLTVATDKRIPFESPYPSLAEDPVLQYQVGVLSARTLSVAALLESTARLLDEVQQGDAAKLPQLQAQLAATKALAAEVGLAASSEVFSWSGARAADRSLRLDRYWRNVRTHTLHDPVRLRYQELGRSQIFRFVESSVDRESH
ncbi:acyl-CoA dehydrogenase family protein [Erwinia typographi]|uniref:acyl-CoA dehydrogenase family protein n=1 Tax=Erwinia typographi TaxID=371042 RepID=UPI000691DB9C|nr:acyl-CoA dehydrogenase family protein [Erwinia typographi]